MVFNIKYGACENDRWGPAVEASARPRQPGRRRHGGARDGVRPRRAAARIYIIYYIYYIYNL